MEEEEVRLYSTQLIPKLTLSKKHIPAAAFYLNVQMIQIKLEIFYISSLVWRLTSAQVAVYGASSAKGTSGLIDTTILFFPRPFQNHVLDIIFNPILDLIQISIPL